MNNGYFIDLQNNDVILITTHYSVKLKKLRKMFFFFFYQWEPKERIRKRPWGLTMKTRSLRREEEDESMPRKRSGVIGWSSDLKTMVVAMENPLPNAIIKSMMLITMWRNFVKKDNR